MIDQILSRENLRQAWEQVLEKKGGPGIDQVTLARWGRNWEANLARLSQQVRTNTYRPNRPKRFIVRKKGGGSRELSRLTVTDKVLQRAVLNVIDPPFDLMFLDCSHGYRQQRSVGTAVEQVLGYRSAGLRHVLHADIEACFENLDHTLIMSLVRQVIADWFVLNLMELWLKAGRKHRHRAVGVPMGAVLSPLWANIVLHQMDRALSLAGHTLVRYADDFLVLGRNVEIVQGARPFVEAVLAGLRLRVSEPKTWTATFEQGFEFLGVTFFQDTYSYLWQQKRITIQGRRLKMLYSHLPDFYRRED
jgi:group II intron reverse transcriptase/maturase